MNCVSLTNKIMRDSVELCSKSLTLFCVDCVFTIY